MRRAEPDRSVVPEAKERARSRVGRALSLALVFLGSWLIFDFFGWDSSSLSRIRELHEQGRYRETIELLRERLDDDPYDPRLNLLYGEALLRVGEAGSAVWPLRRAVESPDHAVEGGILLATAQLQGASPSDALRAVEDVLAIEPENRTALYLRAQAHTAALDFDEALADFDRLIGIDPDDLRARVYRIVPLIRLHREDEAQASIAALRERFDQLGPAAGDLAAHFCAAEATFAHERGEVETATTHWKQCLAEYPENQALLSGAVDFYGETGQRQEAIALLRSALARDPVRGDVRVALAAQLDASGAFDEALEILLEGTREHPSAPSFLALADHYVAVEDFTAARDAAAEALARIPGTPPDSLVVAYAEILVLAGDHEEAEDRIRDVDSDVYRDLLRGRLALARGDPASALPLLERGLRLWPNNAGARALAGRAAEQLGDFERAISEYKEALRDDLTSSSAAISLARLLAAQGANRDATEILQRYLQERPQDIAALALLARVVARATDPSAARNVLRRLAEASTGRPHGIAETARTLWEISGPGAVSHFVDENALDLSRPELGEVLHVLVEAEIAAGHPGRASARVDDALRTDPDRADLLTLRGSALRAADRQDEARAAFERALELDPAESSASTGIGRILEDAGDLDAAVLLYDRATATDPDAREPSFAAALARASQGRIGEAERRLREHLRRHPHDAEAAASLARLWLEHPDVAPDADRIVAMAQRSVRFRGAPASQRSAEPRGAGEASARYWLARAWMASGDSRAATAELRRALEIDDAFPEAGDALEQLRAHGG